MTLFDEFTKIAASDIRPFHDDQRLQRFILNSISEFDVKTFFETGTFRGDSLKWLAERVPKVECYSVENKKLYYLYARMNVRFRNVSLIEGDSRKVLNERWELLETPVLFWLDAHWEEDFPLPEELGILRRWGRRAVILLDDFKHPTRNLGFDSYRGQDICIDLVDKYLPEVSAFVPNYEAPRGYAVLFQHLQPSIDLVRDLERIR